MILCWFRLTKPVEKLVECIIISNLRVLKAPHIYHLAMNVHEQQSSREGLEISGFLHKTATRVLPRLAKIREAFRDTCFLKRHSEIPASGSAAFRDTSLSPASFRSFRRYQLLAGSFRDVSIFLGALCTKVLCECLSRFERVLLVTLTLPNAERGWRCFQTKIGWRFGNLSSPILRGCSQWCAKGIERIWTRIKQRWNSFPWVL